MRERVYLTFDRRGIRTMTKRAPSLQAGTYAVALTVMVPDEYFARAIPTAELTIPEGYIVEPVVDVVLEMPPEPDVDEPEPQERGGAVA
jgi:hypothetical protein